MFKHSKRLIFVVGLIAVSAFGLASCSPNARVLALAGSDTTQDVMGAISNSFNAGPSDDTASNIPPVLGNGQTFNRPGDKECGAFTYTGGGSTADDPPNGSSSGITALVNDSSGCIDIARSSRDKRASDPANLDFYAFAKDAVSWARFPVACPGSDAGPVGCAPSNLTQAQLQGIFLCTEPGGPAAGNVPLFTNWAQVGGDNAPIARFVIQAGSGTGSFFQTRILGLSTAQQNVLDDTACEDTPVNRVQENSGQAVPAFVRPLAIVGYSFAQWTAQGNGTVPNIRAGAQLGQINGVTVNATNVNNNTFLGRRWVYNVVKTSGPSHADAVDMVGVDAGGNGFLCTNDAAKNTIITNHGFILAPFAAAGGGVATTSRCRKNPAPL